MSPLFVALAVGLGIYFLFIMIFPKAIPEEKNVNIKTALNRLYEENLAIERSKSVLLNDELREESPLVRGFFSLPFMDALHEAGLAAGYQNKLTKLLMTLMFVSFGVFLLLTLSGNGTLGLILALPLGYILTLRHCKKIVRKRTRRFIDQFPDALDMIVRSVRSGFPLTASLQMVAENAEPPVCDEFRKVGDDVALGRTLNQALARLALRIPEADVRFFGIVLTVQQETGGNLSEIIGNLSGVIRKRKQLRHKIKAMTSEGKATGFVLGGLPVFVFCALYFVQPGYLTPFWTDPLGEMFFGGTLVLLTVCFFVVRAMIDVDI